MIMVRKNDKEHLVSYNNTIKKSNEWVLAKLNQGLTLNQMQLLAFAIYSTQQNNVTEFIKADFEKKFDISNYLTPTAKKDTLKLMDLKLQFSDAEADENGDYTFGHWNVFQSITYKKGLFSFKWTEEILPHILEINEKYVLTDLTTTAKFKSSFSWTLYEYLKAHYGYWRKTVEKSTLLGLFGVADRKSYQNTSTFKKGVLDIAIAEINKYTEYDVRYEDVREGKAIVGFKFIWSVGKTIVSATPAQVEMLQETVNAIFDDLFKYLDIKDTEKREQAINLVRQAESYRTLIKDTTEADGLTAEVADKAIKEVTAIHEKLEALYELRDELPPEKPPVGFYNWLEERE